MKNVMKTILRNTKLLMILAFLPALLSAAQAQAVDYKNVYMSSQQGTYANPGYQVQTTAPSAAFQSTSAYSSQWVEQENATPMLNSDGSVNDEAYGVGPKRRPGSIRKDGPGTPGEGSGDEDQPLGDGMWPLMLCACAYLIVRATRKEKKIG